MALTQEMLDEFKKLSSEHDTQLLRVTLTDKEPVYGYLRSVKETLFVIDEVKGKKATQSEIEKIGESTYLLSLVESWTKIEPHIVPRIIPVRLGSLYTRRRN